MALLIAHTDRRIELSLDALVDFDSTVDLVGFGLARNAPAGLRVRKISFFPSAQGDTIYVRDGQNGPIIFGAVNVLGTYDTLKDEYRDDSQVDKGQIMEPYIHANECIIALPHLAYIVFEL
jgi:hypothetical protein